MSGAIGCRHDQMPTTAHLQRAVTHRSVVDDVKRATVDHRRRELPLAGDLGIEPGRVPGRVQPEDDSARPIAGGIAQDKDLSRVVVVPAAR